MRVTNMSFQRKLFLSYSLVISTILITLTLIFYLYTLNTVNHNLTESTNQLAVKITQQTDSMIKEMDRISLGLLYNKEFKNIISIKEPSYNSSVLEYQRRMQDILDTLNTPDFIAYRIIAFNNLVTYVSTGMSLDDNDKLIRSPNDWPWKNALLHAGTDKLILNPHKDDWSNNGNIVFSLIRNVLDINRNSLGAIEVQQNYSVLQAISEIDSNLGEVFIFKGDSIIYPFSQQSHVEFDGCHGVLSRIGAFESNDNSQSNEDSLQCLDKYAYHHSGYTGWTVFIKKNTKALYDQTNFILFITLIFLISFTVVTLLVVNLITKRLVKPLKKIIDAVKTVNLDNFSLSIPDDSNNRDEIARLNKAFERMFHKLKQSIAELVSSRTNESTAHYLALQSQMNPHFIYNTISMIESIAYTKGEKQISAICNQLTSMLRYSSDFSNNEVTINDELNHIRSYLELMTSRYEEYLSVSIASEPALLHQKIPKLSLQPLIENAIEHGFFNINPPWNIRIHGSLTDGFWSLSITDNGCGLTPEKLDDIRNTFGVCDANLLEYKEISKFQIGGMGLANIYTRLKLLYKEDCSFSIVNVEPRGCSITIRAKYSE